MMVSLYIVVTSKGYTNHYYAGSERIASRIGNRCWTITATDEWEKPSPEEEALQIFWNIGKEEYPFGTMSDYNSPTTNTTPINGYEEKVQYDCTPVELPRVDILHSTDMLGYTINCVFSYQNNAPVYYYHTDHLGSTSWVTNESGYEHQFIAYLPYGEPLLDIPFDHYDSRYGMDSVRYKFTGKERDAETGYDYMEQRYYYPPLSIWLRPDPLLDKYIYLSPYVYCNGNPLKYVDPDGEFNQNYICLNNYSSNSYNGWIAKYDDSRLHLWLHGSKKGLYSIYFNGKTTNYDVAAMGISKLSMRFSQDPKIKEIWKNITQNAEYDGPREVVFHGCYTSQLAEAFAKEYPGVYFTGATKANHTEVQYFDSQATDVESGIYDYIIPIGDDWGLFKRSGEWKTFYCDPQTKEIQIIESRTDKAPPIIDMLNER